MDITNVISTPLNYLKFIIPIITLFFILKSSWFKGKIGEFHINFLLKRFLDNEDFHLLKNITIPCKSGTTQIDHILISKYGIFVVETKNYKGWIFGSEKQKTWTQVIYKKSYKFQNPLHQNYKHLKCLEDILGISDHYFFSVIIFSNEATFKTKLPINVTFPKKAINYIQSQQQELLSHQEVQGILKKIQSVQLKPGLKTNFLHIQNLNENHLKKDFSQSCPKCNGNLVVRVNKKGSNIGNKFLGCSNFPKCRYTEKVL